MAGVFICEISTCANTKDCFCKDLNIEENTKIYHTFQFPYKLWERATPRSYSAGGIHHFSTVELWNHMANWSNLPGLSSYSLLSFHSATFFQDCPRRPWNSTWNTPQLETARLVQWVWSNTMVTMTTFVSLH